MDLKGKNDIGIESTEKKEKKFDWNKVKENRVFLFFKRHIKTFVILLILAYAGVTAYQVYAAVQASKTVSTGEKQNFEEVTARDISNSVAVTGTIAAKESRTLSTLVSKTEVTDVFVEVGDYVNVGDPICTFDTSSIESNIKKLQRQITVNNAKATLELAKANTQVAWAWEDYFYDQSQGEYELGSAMNSYIQQQNSVADAIDNLNSRERELDSLRDEYHDYKKAKREGTVSEGNYKNSSSAYKDAIASAEEAVSSAGRSVENSQIQLQNTVDNYNKTVEELKRKGVTDLRTISNNMASVVETQLNNMTTNDSAEEQIRDYEKSLENCNITAPISGLVTSVSVVEGDEYDEKSTICVIQDDSSYIVSGTVDQYDIADLTESMNCVIKTDATGDDQMEGVLTFVSPVPQSSSSSTTTAAAGSSSSSSSSAEYPIEITIKGRDDRLRIGMTAEASILLESREGVKAVPYDAIEEADDGTFYINKAVSKDDFSGDSMPDFDKAGSSFPGGELPSGEMPTGEFTPGEKPSGDFPSPTGKSSSSSNKDSYSENPLANLIAEKVIGKSAAELYVSTAETPTKKITVEKGLETDYYTEIISDEVEIGDEVLIPNSSSGEGGFGFGDMDIAIGGGPGGGGPGGGGPGGGGPGGF